MTFRLKRRAAPRTWPLPRKGTKWVLRPGPGPHPQEECLPLGLALRDILHITASARESRILLREGKVRIDGKVVKDPARGVGLMDVVSSLFPSPPPRRSSNSGASVSSTPSPGARSP
jgi:small subunit ribosomal protein S4e